MAKKPDWTPISALHHSDVAITATKRCGYMDQGIELRIADFRTRPKQVVTAFVATEAGEYEFYEPALVLDKTKAQGLMDDLWECGLRPSEGTGSAGSLAATQRHLADMKTVAWHALKIREGG
jgi:hypothetical protein